MAIMFNLKINNEVYMKSIYTVMMFFALAACAPHVEAMSKERKKDILTVLGSGVMATVAAKYLKGFDTQTALTIGASAGLWPLIFRQCATNKEFAARVGAGALALLMHYMLNKVVTYESISKESAVLAVTLGVFLHQLYSKNKRGIYEN